jgi:hypothetical protein
MTDVYVLPPPVHVSSVPEWSQSAQSASHIWSIAGVGSLVAGRLDNFTVSASAGTDATTTFAQTVTLTTGPKPEPTDGELAEAGLAAVAEFERQFGPISDEVIAEIQRKWPS